MGSSTEYEKEKNVKRTLKHFEIDWYFKRTLRISVQEKEQESASGFVSHKYGPHPDPYQNVTDPEHFEMEWYRVPVPGCRQ
jgi:hypothetical protein